MVKWIRSLLLVILILHTAVTVADPEQLKTQDVTKIMKQIFEHHVDKKEISASIINNSFRVYIDQFDPQRIYLLEEEVRPFLQLSAGDIAKIIEQYKRDEFPEYTELNDVIQKAILRARQFRSEIEQNKEKIFLKSQAINPDLYEDWQDPDLKRVFAKSPEELKDRIRQQITHFIAEERKRYGESQVTHHQAQTLAWYEKNVRAHENQYLFQNDMGNPLSSSEKENLFVMHVLKALASSLDAHTTIYNNAEAYDMRVRLEKEFQGIGVVLQQTPKGEVIVSQIIPGSPAAKSGLVKLDDRILEVDGKLVSDEPFEKIIEMLHGKSGTKISLLLSRIVDEGSKKVEKTFNVQLKREDIVVNQDRVDTSYETFGDGIIGKITLHSFYQGENGISSENDIREAIKNLEKIGKLRGLILDLRENSGGFLSQAVKVAGIFITNGIVVISKYSNGEERFYRDMENKIAYDGPLVILTSKATASAAEIVAQALQDYGVALVVGDKHTYGKGTIQSQTVTENEGPGSMYFKVTVGKYYTVSGKTPQIQGVKADIIAPSQFAYENLGEEYLEYPLTQDTIPPSYNDQLTDIDPSLRPWYLRYYAPTIQHKKDFWRAMIPILKKNSEYRIEHNKVYQRFIQDNQKLSGDLGHPNNSGIADLQMEEAVNIVKDMITLQSQMRHRNEVLEPVDVQK
jgi:carboxyl-terminal processing protease